MTQDEKWLLKYNEVVAFIDLAHGLSADRRLILNPFSHDDVETPFYHMELLRLITCCERLASVNRKPLISTSQVHREVGRIFIHNGGHQAEATFVYNEGMYLYELEGASYYTLPKVRVLTCTADATVVGKERELNALYRVLYNSVSYNATTCPKLKDVLYKSDGTLLLT